MATKNTTKRATKTENCGREHIEPKNEGTKSVKSGKGAKDCKNCK